jgi:uncharacterized protein (TIGR02271 family)
MTHTLVGIFDDEKRAQSAVSELTAAGVKQGDITIATSSDTDGYMTYGGPNSKDYASGTSIGTKVSDFFASMFGADVDEDERGLYAESVRRGSTVVTAHVEDILLSRASDVMNTYGAVDLDRRAAQYKAAGYKQYDPTAPVYSREQVREEAQAFGDATDIALPVIEESLQVGKRTVPRGGVRVVSRQTERPVEETVSLRREDVHVERRPVDRDVSQADLAAVRNQAFDVTTTNEEAVVSKQARVVEEVVIGKHVTEHEETIRDTVRRTDVEVETIDAPSTTRGSKAKR